MGRLTNRFSGKATECYYRPGFPEDLVGYLSSPSVGLWAWARHNEKACAAGVLPHFILSFILRHLPIFDVSDFPMLLGFRFSTDRTIDSISVSFYHFVWDF